MVSDMLNPPKPMQLCMKPQKKRILSLNTTIQYLVFGFLICLLTACPPSRKTTTTLLQKPPLKTLGDKTDVTLKQFLMAVKKDVETYNWDRFLKKCSQQHYKTQVVGMDMGEAQYIGEMMGLHSVGNSIKTSDILSFEDLEQIQRIVFDMENVDAETLYEGLTGTVYLKDGTSLKVRLYLRNLEGGGYELFGAVG